MDLVHRWPGQVNRPQMNIKTTLPHNAILSLSIHSTKCAASVNTKHQWWEWVGGWGWGLIIPTLMPTLALTHRAGLSVHKTAEFGRFSWQSRKVSIKLPRLAVIHDRAEKCPYNCWGLQFSKHREAISEKCPQNCRGWQFYGHQEAISEKCP